MRHRSVRHIGTYRCFAIRWPLLGKRCRQERAGAKYDGVDGWRVEGRRSDHGYRLCLMELGVAGGFTGAGACEPRGMTESAEAMGPMEPRHCHGGVDAEVSLLWGSGPFGCRVA